jgi:polyhydroxyalkanoate synthesis repressor PhaR
MAEQQRAKPEAEASTPSGPPVVVKKYANRRLYNTEASSYVTLDDLAAMVRKGRDFVVYDAKSGDDITRSVLTQIIVEQEAKGENLLPIPFLRTLIGYYGDNMQTMVPRYLEFTMGAFARQQEQVRRNMETAMGGFMPFGDLSEVGKQNMAMMERAMSLFSPFARNEAPAAGSVEALRAEIEELRAQLARAEAAKS